MKTFALLFALLALGTTQVNAETTDAARAEATPSWEISGGANVTFTHRTFGEGGSSSRFLLISGDVDHFCAPQVEFGLHLGVGILNVNGTTSAFDILVGPTYNFSSDIENSFFIQARAGIQLQYNGARDPNFTRFAYLAGIGKRFEIVSHVSYMPEFGLLGHASSTSNGFTQGSQMDWSFIPVQFSFTF